VIFWLSLPLCFSKRIRNISYFLNFKTFKIVYMVAELEDKDLTKIFKTSIIQQTAYWSEVKKLQGITTKAFNFRAKKADLFVDSNDESYFIGDLLVLIQKVDHEH